MFVIIAAYVEGNEEPLIEDNYKFNSEEAAVKFCEDIADWVATNVFVGATWKEQS